MRVEILTMQRRELLPGVTTPECPPVVVQDSKKTLRRARTRAAVIEAAQLVLLAGVDVLFLRWPLAHIPTFGRDESLLILMALNIAMLGSIWMFRAAPRWKAQRIARTWCPREQSRFFGK